MRTAVLLFFLSALQSSPPEVPHLSDAQIAAAVALPANSGFVYIEDAGFFTASMCKAQMPSESLFTAAGWINAQNLIARKQFLPFHPSPEDTLQALRVISRGCASGTPSGPVCDTITRAVLLSDKAGTVTAEAIENRPFTLSWQNGFGAQASCTALTSLFSMDDLKRVSKGGSFYVATFSGTQLLKTYEVKAKHLKKLGL